MDPADRAADLAADVDLRMAVGEAASLVLAEAQDPAVLVCSFHLAARAVTVTLAVPSAAPTAPDRDGFGWQVLTTLATHAWVEAAVGSFGVRLTLGSSVGRRPADPGSPGSPGESDAFVIGAP